jgi:HD-like signal output (HDOD) protein/CheY-like chemotaxis protein
MLRIMFVDDEQRVLDGIRRNLLSHRHIWDMQFVANAPAALSAMEVQPVDVVVADFRMPGMDGGHLLSAVRDRWPDTGRLMLSGHTDEDDLIKVVSVAHRFLDKPCDRDVLVTAIEQALWLRAALEATPIRAEIGGIDALPSGAGTLRRLHDVLDSTNSTVDDMAAIVERDVGLTVKVLQLANSSLFGDGREVTSVHAALSRLGLHTARSISLMLELITPVRVEGAISDEWLDRLNMHASLSARIATRLVRRDESADAFCAAIVAECGQLVFATCRPAAFARTINSRQRRDGVVTDAEHTEFGVSHAQAGAYLLSLWGFPTSVVEAVATHDRMPGAELSVPMSVPDAVRVAREIADRHIQRICSARATQDGDRQITFDGWLDDPDLLTADWSLDNDARPLRFAATTTPVPPLGQPGDDHGKVGVGT